MIVNWLPGMIFAFLATFIGTRVLREWFMKIKVQQLVMRNGGKGPDHQAKMGTPTMGGAGFIVIIFILFIFKQLFSGGMNPTSWAMMAAMLLYALVGGFDDSIKIFEHRDEGFRFLPKLGFQIFAGVVALALLLVGKFNFVLNFGFLTVNNLAIFAVLTILWLVGWSNAVNLTDGLDGLATGLAIIAYSVYLLVAIKQGNSDIAFLNAVIIGALLAFFTWNQYPAHIFMGDTGSLALGAGLAMNALVLHVEWSILLVGLVFMLETLSVIIQVGSFRLRNGKRVFLMTPIHHAFEKGGITMNPDKPWSEWRVDLFFWAVGLVAAIIYLVIFL
ncbi:MAG: phospho-N-acetylmuramoyl-pentapeptide-transferase [Lactobacillaceae bacterium]|jgi:phospho-N-acetylmuramoyl-pentapeptide-transferase|nr:phospho-N-acetylmuramoyl-pentapeptide-transferase [Lactobacillaceae bacterium]